MPPDRFSHVAVLAVVRGSPNEAWRDIAQAENHIVGQNRHSHAAAGKKSGKTVAIPEIGNVRHRQCSVGGDEEPQRYETDPFTRNDGHGGKVCCIIRVNTDKGNQEILMRSVRWVPPGTMP